MKFRDLDKEYQESMIEGFRIAIENKADEEGIEDYEEPTIEEYEKFFDEFVEDYEIIDGYPVNTDDYEYHNKYGIEFKDGKVDLIVFNPEDDNDDHYY